MPFVAAFHVSLGGPWILVTFLTEAIFLSVFVYTSNLEEKKISEEKEIKAPVKPDSSISPNTRVNAQIIENE